MGHFSAIFIFLLMQGQACHYAMLSMVDMQR